MTTNLEYRSDDGQLLRVEDRRAVEAAFRDELARARWTTFRIATLGSLLGGKSVRERAVASMFEASAIAGRSHRVVMQGVHMLMGGTPGNDWEPGEQRQSVVVFIGRNLPRDVIEGGLRNALVQVARPA